MSKWAIFKRLLGFVRPFWRRMALSVLLGVLTISSSIGLMATAAWLISMAGLQPSIAALGVAPTLVRFFGISRAVFRYLERLVSHSLTFRLLADLRVWFYERLEPLAPAILADYRSGDLLGRVVTDIETLENVYLRVIAPPLVALVVAILTTALFWGFEPLAGVVLLAFALIAATLPPLVAWTTGQGPGHQLVHIRSEINAALVDGIQGLADSTVYGYTDTQINRLNQLHDSLIEQENIIARLDAMQHFLAVLLVHMASVAVLAISIPRVEPIWLATLTLATVAAFEAITPLATAAQNLGANMAAAERLFDIVDNEPTVIDAIKPKSQPDDYTLTIDNVSFQYKPELPPALDGISFTIRPGERVAIVGASGAGKSTLINLLLRFYDYHKGSIAIGGVSLKDLSQADVHRLFGVMSQRTHLFNTTIRENIRIAHIDAPEKAEIAAAQQAEVHDFIESLPDGYMTITGESGAKLSGGERQRIALARVLLKNAPIIILDEATANLDAHTERAVLANILKATEGRTLLVITHRLTLLNQMDRILVLDQRRVVESGTHEELLAQDGHYRQLWEAQQRIIR